MQASTKALYAHAGALETAGALDEAIAVYERLSGYEDSSEKIAAIRRVQAQNALDDMDLDLAREKFTIIEDQAQLTLLDTYQAGTRHAQERNYADAIPLLIAVGDYLDAPAQLAACQEAVYDQACREQAHQRIQEAHDLWQQLGAYSDSAERVKDIEDRYSQAGELASAGNYASAAALYHRLYNYADSATLRKECFYLLGQGAESIGDYVQAEAYFALADDYKDAQERLPEAYYMQGVILLEAKDWDNACTAFEKAGTYQDAATLLKEAHYQKATALQNPGKYAHATMLFRSLRGYRDSAKLAELCTTAYIAAGAYHTVGLKSDGTVVAVGSNEWKQCNVSAWRGIKVP